MCIDASLVDGHSTHAEDYLPGATMVRLQHGFVVSAVGDAGFFTCMKSRRGDADLDRAFADVLQHAGDNYACSTSCPTVMMSASSAHPDSFYPWAGQCVRRTGATRSTILHFNPINPKGEPELEKRGLYRVIGSQAEGAVDESALLRVLNLAEGQHSLLDIVERAGCPFSIVRVAANVLHTHDLLREEGTDAAACQGSSWGKLDGCEAQDIE